MSRDMMRHFELIQPSDMDNAFEVLERYGENAWKLAGGQDSYDWFKDRVKQPQAVVDLNGIEELKGVRETPEGIEIGALTTLSEVAENEAILGSYSLLAQAASRVASPQIRNVGTIGGNVCQDTRCWGRNVLNTDVFQEGPNTQAVESVIVSKHEPRLLPKGRRLS